MTVQPRGQQRSERRATRLSGTNLEHVGDHNYRVTLQAICVHETITRAKLVELTGLTSAAIANITNRLLQEELILAKGTIQGARGQPPKLFAVNPNGSFSIGVNVDRDHLTVVALDLTGKIRARESVEIDFALPDQVVKFFRKAVARMLAAGKIDPERLAGVGIAIPDRISHVDAPNKPKAYAVWDKTDIPGLFAGIVDGPIFIENDATAAAMGELQFGHGVRQPNFFYMLISAGLGGGLVIDGVQFRGAHGRSGEIGFLPIRSRMPPAQDLGDVVSLRGLYSVLRSGGFAVSRPDELLKLPKKAQQLIEEWLNAAATFLIIPLIAVSCLLDPQAVFIGGRLPPPLVKRLITRLNKSLSERGRGLLTLVSAQPAALGVDAPVVGAALLPFYDRLLPSRAALMKTGTVHS